MCKKFTKRSSCYLFFNWPGAIDGDGSGAHWSSLVKPVPFRYLYGCGSCFGMVILPTPATRPIFKCLRMVIMIAPKLFSHGQVWVEFERRGSALLQKGPSNEFSVSWRRSSGTMQCKGVRWPIKHSAHCWQRYSLEAVPKEKSELAYNLPKIRVPFALCAGRLWDRESVAKIGWVTQNASPVVGSTTATTRTKMQENTSSSHQAIQDHAS